MKITAEFEGLDEFADLMAKFPEASVTAQRMAINQVAQRGALNLARDAILGEINFPKDYLKGDRLKVSKLATDNSLEAVITARKRATSLARFAAPGTPLGSNARRGVRVQVKTAGGSILLRRAWLVRLRQGASLTEDAYNVGLAVRVRPGESIIGKRTVHKSWLVKDAVALLYGPSVDQVFREVADQIAPRVAQMTAAEFQRQFARLTS